MASSPPVSRGQAARDVALFVAGLAGVAHETLISPIERPWLLALFAVMLGLPNFIRLDEMRQRRKEDE